MGAGCLGLIGAGLLCWALVVAAPSVAAWQCLRTERAFDGLLACCQPDPDPNLTRLAERLGLAGSVQRIADRRVWAVTTGFWRPCILPSAGLCERLGDDELAAVLLHEAEHRRTRDPLRLLLARSARVVLGLLPAAGRLLDAFAQAAELAADARAMDGAGRRVLASALWHVREGWAPPAAVPFAAKRGLLRWRVMQIEHYPEPLASAIPGWRDVATLAFAVAAMAAWSLLCLKG